MAEKIAERDITQVNALGQTVVVVPKGQPIPADLDVDAKAVQAPAENKARAVAGKKTRG